MTDKAQARQWMMDKCRQYQTEPETVFVVIGRNSMVTEEMQLELLERHGDANQPFMIVESPSLRPDCAVVCCPDHDFCEALTKENVH